MMRLSGWIILLQTSLIKQIFFLYKSISLFTRPFICFFSLRHFLMNLVLQF